MIKTVMPRARPTLYNTNSIARKYVLFLNWLFYKNIENGYYFLPGSTSGAMV